jgi:TPR repeat protein
MDLEGWHRACVAFRVKLSRDTGVNLTAATCESLLGAAFQGEGGQEASLWRVPGIFYASLGAASANQNQTLPLVHPDHEKVACYCYREAAEVHKHPAGMRILAGCLFRGQGVTEDPAQAVAWYQKAADLGDVSAKASLSAFFLHGDARAGVAQDAARGFALLGEAVDQGHGVALQLLAQCYLRGEGVEKDAVHGVSLLRQAIATVDERKQTPR